MTATNLALGKPAYSSSSVLPYSASRVVEGNVMPIRRWISRTPGWVCLDLGRQYRMDSYTVKNMGAAGWMQDYSLVSFKFQGSNSITSEADMKNNAKWTDIDIVTGNYQNIVTRGFPVVSYRYVRVYVMEGLRCNKYLASLMELEVYKAPDSSLLSNLTLSQGTLTPTFNKNTFSYRAEVTAPSITVIPTAEQGEALIKVNEIQGPSGQPSPSISLQSGDNRITLKVTIPDSSSQSTYSVIVTRKPSPYLTNLTLSDIPFIFEYDVYGYNLSAGYDTASTIITPTLEDNTSSYVITVNGVMLPSGQPRANLNVGVNTIAIRVTATNGIYQDYIIKVDRASSPYLTNMVLNTGRISVSYTPTFNKNVLEYMTMPLGGKTSISITPSSEDATASINVGGTIVTSGQVATLSMPSGNSRIKILVTSSRGGDTKEYYLNVNNG